MPKLRFKTRKQAAADAKEQMAEWVHECYVRSIDEDPADPEYAYANRPDSVIARYRKLAEQMLAAPFERWLEGRNRDPEEPERIVL